jgi:quinol monooxygenase YgiN
MLIVLAEATLGKDALEQGRDAFSAMIAASRSEEGCVSYAYAQDILDPAKLHIVEKWVDEAVLTAHFHKPHMAAFQKALADLDISINEVSKYQADNGSPVM